MVPVVRHHTYIIFPEWFSVFPGLKKNGEKFLARKAVQIGLKHGITVLPDDIPVVWVGRV